MLLTLSVYAQKASKLMKRVRDAGDIDELRRRASETKRDLCLMYGFKELVPDRRDTFDSLRESLDEYDTNLFLRDFIDEDCEKYGGLRGVVKSFVELEKSPDGEQWRNVRRFLGDLATAALMEDRHRYLFGEGEGYCLVA